MLEELRPMIRHFIGPLLPASPTRELRMIPSTCWNKLILTCIRWEALLESCCFYFPVLIVMFCFVFFSAFNTIRPALLGEKMTAMQDCELPDWQTTVCLVAALCLRQSGLQHWSSTADCAVYFPLHPVYCRFQLL